MATDPGTGGALSTETGVGWQAQDGKPGQEAESCSGGWAGVGRSGSCSKTGLQLFCLSLSEREEKVGGVCWVGVGVDEVTVPDGGFFSSKSKWAVCSVEREKRLGRKSAGVVLDCDSDSCFFVDVW